MLIALGLEEEMLTGVGYEALPKTFEDKGVQGLATPKVSFFACLNRDCALSGGDKYDSYSSDDSINSLR